MKLKFINLLFQLREHLIRLKDEAQMDIVAAKQAPLSSRWRLIWGDRNLDFLIRLWNSWKLFYLLSNNLIDETWLNLFVDSGPCNPAKSSGRGSRNVHGINWRKSPSNPPTWVPLKVDLLT